jgi:peptide/nickel transport system substrate-binding protein
VVIDQFDQAELITRALTGGFQVFLWRNHSEPNPANEFVWWHSRHAAGLALNFGRIQDPDIDAALESIRTTDDPAEQSAFAEDLNRRFAENVNNLWLSYTNWAVPYQDFVEGVGKLSLPEGGYAQPMRAGRVWLQEVWLDQ